MTAKDFLTSIPGKVPVAALSGVETNFHFDIDGDGGGQYSVIVSGGTIEVHPSFVGEPKCVVKTSNDTLVGLLKKEINPFMAFMTGKVKVSNQGELLKYAKMFGIG